ncbi:MAG: hypothetical protein D6706_02585 [Chloroflexi bacterium]|nr:MAG: hypothetical protein D6706_02585 [Chloroflexota bacterium]
MSGNLTWRVLLNRHYLAFGLFRVYKRIYQKVMLARNGRLTTLLILGCQRSGTSLMYWIFERDLNTRIYRESSNLSSQDRPLRLRLDPLPEVRAKIERHNAPLVVLKPLVESQNAHQLLAALPDARALWMYRHYRAVAVSNLKAFGERNGINDLRPIVQNEPGNWRAEGVSAETRATIARFFAEDMPPLDAAALFWWARNRLFFELGLDMEPRVRLCRYEALGQQPAMVMREIYAFVNRPYPGDHIVRDVHPRAIQRGNTAVLSPEVEALCADLLVRLDRVYEQIGRYEQA